MNTTPHNTEATAPQPTTLIYHDASGYHNDAAGIAAALEGRPGYTLYTLCERSQATGTVALTMAEIVELHIDPKHIARRNPAYNSADLYIQ